MPVLVRQIQADPWGSLVGELQAYRDPVSKEKDGIYDMTWTKEVDLLCTHMQVYTQTRFPVWTKCFAFLVLISYLFFGKTKKI